MLKLADSDLDAAFRLAYCLHPDASRVIPALIVPNAIEWAERLKKTQEKRPWALSPYKQILPDKALLQAGIYRASYDWERDQESAEPKRQPLYRLTADDLLIRYLEFLVWKTCGRNSCHVAVSLGCHFYRYCPVKISLLAPDCFDEGNIRRVKGRLGRWIEERFPKESRFPITGQKSPTLREWELGRNALIAFVPWDSPHLEGNLPLLETYFHHPLPKFEAARKHGLIDLACAGLPRLIGEYNLNLTRDPTMRLDDPDQKLAIPEFGHVPAAPGNDRFNPDPLSPSELALLKQSVQHCLARNRQHRQAYHFGLLRVCADGEELLQFDPGVADSRQLAAPISASYLEVFGQLEDEEELLLAVFPLPESEPDDVAQPRHFCVVNEGGQRLELIVAPSSAEDEQMMERLVQLDYQPIQAATTSLVRLPDQAISAGQSPSWQGLDLPAGRGLRWTQKLVLLRKILWPENFMSRGAVLVALLATVCFGLFLSLRQPKGRPITTFSEEKKPPVSDWGIFRPGRGNAQETLVIDPDPARGRVMRIAYDVPKDEYVVFWLKFDLQDFRPSEWPVISFWARTEKATKVKIELKLREAKWGWKMQYINVNSNWQRFKLRLRDFQTLAPEGWNQPDEFAVTFDRELSSPVGIIFLDDISFEKE